MKGHEEIREAAEMLRAITCRSSIYTGFVEADGHRQGRR